MAEEAKKKRNRIWRPFEDAREFVRALELSSVEEWFLYRKSGLKPDDIPGDPNRSYKNEFKSYGDWLGTKRVANQKKSYRTYSEARQYIHGLGLKSQAEWKEFCKSGNLPQDIPRSPYSAYKSEFKSWGDWLGTGYVAHTRRHYRPFDEARLFAHSLELSSGTEWAEYCTSGRKPEDIPANPNVVYKGDFKSWGDWVGNGFISTHKRTHLSFAEARSFVQNLGLTSQKEWRAYCNSGALPKQIPRTPESVYEKEFQGIGDWLGTQRIANQKRVYLPYHEARTVVHALNLTSVEEWNIYRKSGRRPENIPANPSDTYKEEFQGYGDWLGIINKWTKKALLSLLHDLRPRLDQLEERELYIILQQGGALSALRTALGGSTPLRILRDLQENEGEGLEQELNDLPDDLPIESTASLEEDACLEEEGNLPILDLEHDFEQESDHPSRGQTLQEEITQAPRELDLPMIASKESLRIIDALAELSCGLDETAAEYLVANRVSALWEVYIHQGKSTVEELLVDDGGHWFQEVKQRFLYELAGVENLVIPAGWSFITLNGEQALPNAMQRRTAWEVREKRRVGNWSGVGAGKTLAAILASRVVDAHLTLIVTNNATAKEWGEQIRNAYPDSIVYLDIHAGIIPNKNDFHYIVLNYDKFQGNRRNHLVRTLLDLHLDFIVLDEVQFVKQRDTQASNRRKALEALVGNAAQINANLRVLGMSATPVIFSRVGSPLRIQMLALL